MWGGCKGAAAAAHRSLFCGEGGDGQVRHDGGRLEPGGGHKSFPSTQRVEAHVEQRRSIAVIPLTSSAASPRE